MNKFFLGAILALITYILILFFTPLVRFRPWTNWWKSHQPKDDTQSCAPMLLLAYQSSSTFLYDIARLFLITENQKLQYDWQSEFILSIMGRWAMDMPNKGDGFLTPYGLCTSIAPQMGDTFFNPRPDVGPNIPKWPAFDTWPAYVSNEIKKKYSQRDLWLGILSLWGLQSSTNSPYYIYNCETWRSKESNFLWRKYQIPGDSSLCLSFVTNTYEDTHGNLWFPISLSTMLGINSDSGAGGWIGLLRSGGDWGDYGLDEMSTYIWSNNKASLPKSHSPLSHCGGPGVASAMTQGISLGLSAAMALGPLGWAAALFGGGTIALVGGLLGAAQYKCFGGKDDGSSPSPVPKC